MANEMQTRRHSCNFRWKIENIYCNFYISTEKDQEHLLSCKYLIWKNEIVTYIPYYQDLFLEVIDAEEYSNRIMKDIYIRIMHLEDQLNRVDIL